MAWKWLGLVCWWGFVGGWRKYFVNRLPTHKNNKKI